MKTLALPAPLETAVKPKPTKAEILEALTVIAMSKMIDEENIKVARRKVLLEEVKAELHALVKKQIRQLPVHDINLGWVSNGAPRDFSLEYEPACVPEKTLRKLVEIDGLPRAAKTFSVKQVRKEVARSMQGYTGTREERINELLNTPETRASLEAMADELGL